MANILTGGLTFNRPVGAATEIGPTIVKAAEALSPSMNAALIPRFRIPEPPPKPAPPPPPAPTLQPLPPTVLPTVPADNPFDSLPFPSPGDRIRADDFKKLSQSLKLISDMTSLSTSLFGMTFGDAKGALLGHGYQLSRVMSVFGVEITDLADASLDGRKVVQVVPAELGKHQLMVVVSEAVDTRRFVPGFDDNKTTYTQAVERLHSLVGELPPGTAAPRAVDSFVGRTLSDVQPMLTK